MAIVKRKKINELKFNLTHGAVPQVHIEDIMQQFSVSIANTLNIKTVLNKSQDLCQTLIYLAILHVIVVSNLESKRQIEFYLKNLHSSFYRQHSVLATVSLRLTMYRCICFKYGTLFRFHFNCL